jgi:hypothetical protein
LSSLRVTMTAQLTIGKSMDLRRANLRNALDEPAAGSGTCIPVTISSALSTVVLTGLTSKNFSASMVRLEVTILASKATSAGAEKVITGRVIDEKAADEAGAAAVAEAKPLEHNKYMVAIARTLVKRSILACAGR